MANEHSRETQATVITTLAARGPGMALDAPNTGREAQDRERALRALAAWLAAARRRSVHTARSYKKTASRFAAWLQGNKGAPLAEALRACRPSDVSAWLTIQGGKETSSAQRLACVRSMFRALAADGVTEGNPAREIRPPRGVEREAEHHKAVPSGLLIKVLKTMPPTLRGKRDRAMILLMANNGLRRSEVAGLKRSDLELDGEEPRIRVRGKGRRVDVLQLRHSTVVALRAWIEVRDVEAGQESDSPVFHELSRMRRARKVRRISGGGVYRAYKRYFPKHGPHGLRARFITDSYIRSDGNMEAARLLGRHVDESTTRGYIQTNRMSRVAVFAPNYE